MKSRKASDDLARRAVIGRAKSERMMSSYTSIPYPVSTRQLGAEVVTCQWGLEVAGSGLASDT
jgi:hypothetical protein